METYLKQRDEKSPETENSVIFETRIFSLETNKDTRDFTFSYHLVTGTETETKGSFVAELSGVVLYETECSRFLLFGSVHTYRNFVESHVVVVTWRG